MIEKGSDEYNQIAYAVKLLETPSLTSKLSNFIGGPIEGALEYLPDGAKEKINDVVHTALHKAADAALWSLDNKPQKDSSNILHKAMAATSGAIGGAFGFSALAVELPISTTIMLRSIADIARSEGFDLAEFETKMTCIEVFSFGGPSKDDDSADSAYYATRGFMMEATKQVSKEIAEIAAKNTAKNFISPAQAGSWLTKFIEIVASRFGVTITGKTAAQAVPVLGGISGAVLNTMFTDYYQDIAKGHFTIKRLEKKYGQDEVKKHYNDIRGDRKQ